jgi:nitrite reductase/ring-hydroxylating ferredoxin subunit
MAAAAITGASDWSDTTGAPRRIGLIHGSANLVAAAAYAASLVLRRKGRRRRSIALSFFAFGWLGLAAYLGGELSSGMHLGVRHVAEPSPPPDGFTDVAADAEVEEGRPRSVEVASTKIVLVRQSGTVYALANACTHRGAPLSDGSMEDGCIRCPWHGSRFELSDGTVREGPATYAQASYDVRIAGGRIAVRLALA